MWQLSVSVITNYFVFWMLFDVSNLNFNATNGSWFNDLTDLRINEIKLGSNFYWRIGDISYPRGGLRKTGRISIETAKITSAIIGSV